MTTIYVVKGTTGEYSDRTEWLACAFTSKGRAEATVREYTAKAEELLARSKLPEDNPLYIDQYDYRAWRWGDNTVQRPQVHPDKLFEMDYTGTSYYMQETELYR